MEVVGVDGTKGGWVAIALDSGRFTDDHLLQPIETSFSDFAGAQIIAVDIPVGFGPRMADAAARRCSPSLSCWGGEHSLHYSTKSAP